MTDITTTWCKKELIPYRLFVEKNYPGMVMVGHLMNRHFDTQYPASLSKKTLQCLLRKKIGFEGVIVIDDLNMGTIVNYYSLEKALALAINGGVNLIVLSNNGKVYEKDLAARCHTIISKMVAEGKINPKRIDDSYMRLQKLINTFGIH